MSARCPVGARLFVSVSAASNDVRDIARKMSRSRNPGAMLDDLAHRKQTLAQKKSNAAAHDAECEQCEAAS